MKKYQAAPAPEVVAGLACARTGIPTPKNAAMAPFGRRA